MDPGFRTWHRSSDRHGGIQAAFPRHPGTMGPPTEVTTTPTRERNVLTRRQRTNATQRSRPRRVRLLVGASRRSDPRGSGTRKAVRVGRRGFAQSVGGDRTDLDYPRSLRPAHRAAAGRGSATVASPTATIPATNGTTASAAPGGTPDAGFAPAATPVGGRGNAAPATATPAGVAPAGAAPATAPAAAATGAAPRDALAVPIPTPTAGSGAARGPRGDGGTGAGRGPIGGTRVRRRGRVRRGSLVGAVVGLLAIGSYRRGRTNTRDRRSTADPG